ncbi:MAG: AAA family ATPase [Candidatus Cybelea sp.]
MIEIVPLSPENELPIAEHLLELVLAEWPDLAQSPNTDRVRIFVGVGLMFEVDLAVEISLVKPRPVAASRLRDGGTATEASLTCGILAIEVKQQSRECFEMDGPEIFPIYGRTRSKRSVGKQIEDGVLGVKSFLKRYTDEVPFIHGLGWLTDMPENELRAAPAYIVGGDATWSDMLQAAATRQRILFADPPLAYKREIETFGSILANKRRVRPRDRAAVNRLTHAVTANGRFEEVKNALGSRQVRLAGRAGSGKSTTLALLAEYVARVRQERLLVLTYNHALCHEIDRLVRSVVNDDALVDRHVRVATLVDFLAHACAELGADIPRTGGHIDYARLDVAFRTFLDVESAEERRSEAAILKELEPDRYAFDYVCIDEAQDCLDSERDLLRILYAPERIVLADGIDQLVRRQTPCDWTTGVKREARLHVDLAQSLRMSRNVADFATAMASAMGLEGWRITPHPKLSGGRIVILPRRYDREFFEGFLTWLKEAQLHPKDLLVCVPPSEIVAEGRKRDSRIGQALRSWGYGVWNGCDEEVRRTEVPRNDEIRVVQYASMRGLEGWSTVLVALDESYQNRVAHPNLHPDDRCTPDDVAKRWLLMALTRAAQTLAITISDSSSEVAGWLRRAASALPDGVVEWETSAEKRYP